MSATVASDSADVKPQELFPLPILFYTPETGIAGGAAALYLTRTLAQDSSARPTVGTASIIYTERKQATVEVAGDLYLQRDQWHLAFDLWYERFPNRFYGIGNSTLESAEESYTPESFNTKLAAHYRILPSIYVAVTYTLQTTHLIEVKTPGLLTGGSVNGSGGGTSSGVGLTATQDTRDNLFAPMRGLFYQASVVVFSSALRSDFTFTRWNLDLRNYFSFTSTHVLAVQGVLNTISGRAPFQQLSTFGGQYILRGYLQGRYRDDDSYALQAEYRLPVIGNLGAVGFAGVGDVANSLAEVSLAAIKFAAGFGVRYFFNPQERISIRLDVGFGRNSSGVYFTMTEAF